jgi:hypothetical protein
LQGFHTCDPNWAVLLSGREESHGSAVNGLFIDAAVSQGFAGDGLIGVGEAKSDGGRTPGFDEVGEVFTLGDVDGNFTAFGAMFFILSAFVLRALLDTKFLHGGVEKLRKTFGVEAVATDPNSFCHFHGCGRDWWQWFAGEKLRGMVAFALAVKKAGNGILLIYSMIASKATNRSIGVSQPEL